MTRWRLACLIAVLGVLLWPQPRMQRGVEGQDPQLSSLAPDGATEASTSSFHAGGPTIHPVTSRIYVGSLCPGCPVLSELPWTTLAAAGAWSLSTDTAPDPWDLQAGGNRPAADSQLESSETEAQSNAADATGGSVADAAIFQFVPANGSRAFPLASGSYAITQDFGCVFLNQGYQSASSCPPDRPSFHTGIDLGAPAGTPIFAAASGTVTFASFDPSTASGNSMIVIEHDGENAGFRTIYLHWEQSFVQAGDVVQAGQPIALVGSIGYSTGPHLHFAVTDSATGESLNPLVWLRSASLPPGEMAGVLRWADLISQAAERHQVPPALIAAIMTVESGGNPDAVSPAGAQGLMQIMPEHLTRFGVSSELWRDPAANIDAGARYLAETLGVGGSVDQAIMRYFGIGCDVLGTCTDQYLARVVEWYGYYTSWFTGEDALAPVVLAPIPPESMTEAMPPPEGIQSSATDATPPAEPTPTPTATPEATPEPTPEPTPGATPGATPESTATPEPTATPTPEATPTPVPTPEPSPTPGATSTPTETPEPTATPEPTPSPTPTATPEPTPEPSPAPTPTPNPTPSSVLDGVEVPDQPDPVITLPPELIPELAPTPEPTTEATAIPDLMLDPFATPTPEPSPTATPTPSAD